ncbi:MAG TPA: methyltransferase domain-containing protein, partial [Planctomycetota bacterium]|nr:methyltransferase domain-containing protein [Planctomycetota bacterium]
DDPIYRPGTRFSQVAADRIAKAVALMRERKAQHILDVGFFPGNIGQALRDAGFSGRLDGLGLLNGRKAEDFQPPYDHLHVQEIDPFHGAIGPLDLGCQYDLILGLEIVEHLIDPLPFFRLIAANLADDGVALVTTPNVSSFGAACRLLLGRSNHESFERSVFTWRSDWRAHIRLYDRGELNRFGEMHGLATVEHTYFVTASLRYEQRKGFGWFLRRVASALVPHWREDQAILYRKSASLEVR